MKVGFQICGVSMLVRVFVNFLTNCFTVLNEDRFLFTSFSPIESTKSTKFSTDSLPQRLSLA